MNHERKANVLPIGNDPVLAMVVPRTLGIIYAARRQGWRVNSINLTTLEVDAVEGFTGQRRLIFGIPIAECPVDS